jgi:hypothetical protein
MTYLRGGTVRDNRTRAAEWLWELAIRSYEEGKEAKGMRFWILGLRISPFVTTFR